MRDRSIDFLKGISIIAIVLCHASQIMSGINSVLITIVEFGQLGCQGFFFFTGYLLTSKYDRHNCRIKDGWGISKNSVKKVIVPWYLMIFLYVCLTNLQKVIGVNLPFITNTQIKSVIVNMIFLNGIIPEANNNVVWGGWYMGTLTILWFLFPVLYATCKKKCSVIYIYFSSNFYNVIFRYFILWRNYTKE